MGSDAFTDRNATGFLASATASDAESKDVLAEIKLHMRPELLNRLDEILVFRPLTPATMRRIVDKQLAEALKRLDDRGWHVTVSGEVPEALANLGYSKEYGARPLLRVIEASLLGQVRRLPPGEVAVGVVDGALVATGGESAGS
jgi:ATP-dependent Clp protease ATP-binding subunit ClpA